MRSRRAIAELVAPWRRTSPRADSRRVTESVVWETMSGDVGHRFSLARLGACGRCHRDNCETGCLCRSDIVRAKSFRVRIASVRIHRHGRDRAPRRDPVDSQSGSRVLVLCSVVTRIESGSWDHASEPRAFRSKRSKADLRARRLPVGQRRPASVREADPALAERVERETGRAGSAPGTGGAGSWPRAFRARLHPVHSGGNRGDGGDPPAHPPAPRQGLRSYRALSCAESAGCLGFGAGARLRLAARSTSRSLDSPRSAPDRRLSWRR